MIIIVAALLIAQAAQPPVPDWAAPFIWPVVGLVLLFGVSAAIKWLRTENATTTNPVIKGLTAEAITILQDAQTAVGPNGTGAQQIALSLEKLFAAHTVAAGAPHEDDPRAAK